jgi:hypothetical protein
MENSPKSKQVAIRIYDPVDKTHLKTFKVGLDSLITEITDSHSPLHIDSLKSHSGFISLNYEKMKVDDYGNCFQLIRTPDQKKEIVLSKMLKEMSLQEVLDLSQHMKTIGACNIQKSIELYLSYWKPDNFQCNEERAFFSFHEERKLIVLRKKIKCVFKKIPTGLMKQAWLVYIEKKYPEAEIITKDDGAIVLFIVIAGTIGTQGFDVNRYEKLIKAYGIENPNESIYFNSNILSEKIDDFFGQVVKRTERNGFKISDDVMDQIKIVMIQRGLKETNIIGIISLFRDTAKYCNTKKLRIIERSIYQTISECIYYDSSIFEILFTLLLLDVSGLLSETQIDSYSISIIGIFTLFFSDRLKVGSMNPDVVYNFLVQFIPKKLFKLPGHVYISLPEAQRVYPKIESEDMEVDPTPPAGRVIHNIDTF